MSDRIRLPQVDPLDIRLPHPKDRRLCSALICTKECRTFFLVVFLRHFARMVLYRRWLLAHHLEAAAGYHHPTPTAAGEYAGLAHRDVAGCRLGCPAYPLHILHPHKCVVNVTAQHTPARPRYHPEHAQRVLMVVLVIRAALAAY